MNLLAVERARNITKTWIMMGLFLVLAVVAGYGLSAYTGSTGYLKTALLFALGTNVLAYWFSDRIALYSTGAKPADRTRYPELYLIIEELAQKEDMPMPSVYIIEDEVPNAFATGRSPSHASVAATTGSEHPNSPLNNLAR